MAWLNSKELIKTICDDPNNSKSATTTNPKWGEAGEKTKLVIVVGTGKR